MCDILAAISYSYGYHERPRKRVKINMTIPSRPAPPPPQRNTSAALRYTPTTDWDFCAFGTTANAGASGTASTGQTSVGSGDYFQPQHQQNVKAKKPPPPRPPPPKLPTAVPTAPLKKPGQPQSINILSSLFGHKRPSNGAAAPNKPTGSAVPHQKHGFSSGSVKLLPPPPSANMAKHGGKGSNYAGGNENVQHIGTNYGSLLPPPNVGSGSGASAEMQLISFDSPPSSPTFTQKSCSDCISVDSFSSDSNYSSPNNGSMSQAESGFEDDFVACGNSNRPRASSSVPWGDLDPFEGGSTAGTSSGRAKTAPPPVIYGTIPLASSSSTAQIRTPLINSKLQKSDFVDPLCNGQSVLPRHPTMSMPTIIKPPTSSNTSDSQKSTPSHSVLPRHVASASGSSKQMAPIPPAGGQDPYAGMEADSCSDVLGAFDSLPSQPMPSIPPPPPPPATEAYAEDPYGIALYDFQGEADEDLSFKANEKIYLLKRLTEEWYMGRDKRGLEGMFPVNYVEVKVPLVDEQSNESVTRLIPATSDNGGGVKVRALYNFKAEAPEDLTIMENDVVVVLYQITPEWLYGEINGRRGQFPANYIEFVPPNLPQMEAVPGNSSS